ncbi:MAG: type IVB secretion system protein IcmH/DotU [Paracoccaceae bacterium]
MADKDPFAEPDDSDRTVIRPNPAGRRSPQPAPQDPPAAPFRPNDPAPSQGAFGVAHAASAPKVSNPSDPGVDAGLTGMNPLNACAATLFSLVSRIRNRAQHMDAGKLREAVITEVKAFESRAFQAGVDAQDLKIARYAICATLDDVVLNTPWGGQSVWAQQSMVGTFHRETVGGDRFYDLLARLEKEPARNIDLLEFLYMCLSLGFEGRLRVEQGGREKHLDIRAGLAKIIRAQRDETADTLSPNWLGVNKPYRALSAWKPLWIASGAAMLLLAMGFVGLSWLLSNSTERVLGQLSLLDTGQIAALDRPAPPPPPTIFVTPQIEEIKGFLEEEIDEGIVTVFEDANTITVRITGSGMFGSGSDQLQEQFRIPLERVADALNDQPGPVIIVGHSDNVPIRSSRFPSNMHLSLARAKSVMEKVAATLTDPSRLTAEGRADKDPIASNDTAEGRATNRRIEVVLVREDAA